MKMTKAEIKFMHWLLIMRCAKRGIKAYSNLIDSRKVKSLHQEKAILTDGNK